ncbi:MAG: lysophospholipase [Gammaproteobacteria bacterium]|nr:lysophospholipase [Gammaproteobacteria bacterium]MCW8923876.1 lysophospholipase [Gammaproteobacteria bacterium]
MRLFLIMMLSGILPACTHLLFQPHRIQYITPDNLGVMYEDVMLETDEQIRLHGWKLLASAESRGTILFFHGNAENISTHFANVHWLTGHGYDVYLFDYRGYGQSGGEAKLDAVIDDMELMIGYSVGQLPEAKKLIIMGHSLGGSLAIHAVAHSGFKHRIETLITVEAFSDYHEVTQDVLSTSWLTWLFQWPLSFTVDNSYRPLDSVAQIAPIPLMLMHSRQDEIIPFEHAEALYEAAIEPKKLQVITGRHNMIFSSQKNRELLLNYLFLL